MSRFTGTHCFSKRKVSFIAFIFFTTLFLLILSSWLLQKKETTQTRAGFHNPVIGIPPLINALQALNTIKISKLYIQDTFSQTDVNSALETIKTVWAEEKDINKHIDVSLIEKDPQRIIRFDPRKQTTCIQSCYNKTVIAYFPEEFCDDKYQIAITSFDPLECGMVVNKKRVWVELGVGNDASTERNRYAVKHELGHLFGAPHPFDMSISSNDRFKCGISRSKEIDVMNYNHDKIAGEYTKYIINNNYVSTDYNNYSFINGVHNNAIRLTSDDVIDFSRSTFSLYGASPAQSEVTKGIINDQPACYYAQNDPIWQNEYAPEAYKKTFKNNIPSSQGIVSDLDRCFFTFPYVSGFIELSYEGKTYQGSFDLIDLGLAKKNKQPYATVKLRYVYGDVRDIFQCEK